MSHAIPGFAVQSCDGLRKDVRICTLRISQCTMGGGNLCISQCTMGGGNLCISQCTMGGGNLCISQCTMGGGNLCITQCTMGGGVRVQALTSGLVD